MKRILINALSLVFCFIMLVSCGTSNSVDETTEESTNDSSKYVPSESELLLIADNQAYCGIVRPKDGGEYLETLCTELTKAIRQSTGVNVKRYSDEGQIDDNMVEILIGDTNRPESTQAKKKLGTFEYSVSVINGKVVVVGSDEAMLENAINHLLGVFQKDSENGVWTIAKDYNQKLDGSDYRYNAYIGKDYELTTEYTWIQKMSASTGMTTAGERIPWAQGGCTDGTYYYYCMITDNSVTPTKCVILKYDLEKQTLVKASKELKMGHANDVAYNPHNNTLVVAEAGPSYYVIDPETLTVLKTVQMYPCWSISYDENRRMYILALDTKLYFYNDNYEYVKEMSISGMMTEFESTGTPACQGITSDDKYIYYLEYWQSKTNYKDILCNIVVYDLYTCEFIDRIPLYMGREVENIIIWNNSFYIVCNNINWTGAECYQVKIVPKL